MDFFEQIPAYLNQTLSPEQRAAFETEMERDEDLRMTVEQFPLIMEVLEAEAQDEAIKLVRNTRARLRANSVASRPRRIIPVQWRVAAAVLVVVVAGLLIYANLSFSTSALVSQAYHSPAELGVFQSGDSQDVFWKEIMADWNSGAQTMALILADSFLVQYPGDPDAIRRVAHLNFRAGNHEKALSILSPLRNDRQYGDYAEFHSALILLRLGRTSEAQALLDTIASTETHRYNDEAARLLSRLRSVWHGMAFQ